MTFIFPIIYLSSFALSIKGLVKGKPQEMLLFLIFGLPIYITALSITFGLGLRDLIPLFQPFKELLVVTLLGFQVWTLKKRLHLDPIDYAVLTFFGYTFLYALLPIGEQGFGDRLVAFKSLSFFPLIYFCGRLFDIESLHISKYFHFILYVTIGAAALALTEFITYTHFQTQTSFADYNYYFYNIEPSGSHGLSFTFESEGGFKRFASFFANPLEHAGATLLALAIIGALFTRDDYKFKPGKFGVLALLATGISIFLALSRSPFLAYLIVVYVYAYITRKKVLTYAANTIIILGIIYLFYVLKDTDVQQVIVNTFNFSNPSSVGHLLEWIEGITTIINHPFGIGLGTSGRVAGSLGETTGGENQFLIIGVQAGIIALIIYMAIYFSLIKKAWYWYYRLRGKEKKVCLAILLMKIGFIMPSLTSELESSPYISYMTWFFSGLFISIIAKNKRQLRRTEERPSPVESEYMP